ncbi:hypothetical protein UA08_01443 [Talaromyces atroroseus]|uniref:tRNA(Phe) 7-[(3-amino-3-carboxypropyl)-4-demethylwyosine(37)-N(4)]-methyltransferase n=1 Tax=Talaromyces atroroseus TaxID=1441469 RepID=A0A1Q5QA39_TALAT|nr:hypothetical protein UA08_01443 [Talaromyces atroroseus]OKL62796.1 hypothetical protein UA08_01443 [Talaromyces atroroseus]
MTAPLHSAAAAIPPGFIARKAKILSDLSVPDAEYSDLSPKGSVDEGIRDLIRDINVLDGLVTTSSCAGRASVFVEGSKKTNSKRTTGESSRGSTIVVSSQVSSEVASNTVDQDAVDESRKGDDGRKFALVGGKGEGRWLYVSHDPVNLEASSYHKLFGLVPGDGIPRPNLSQDGGIRLIRFHYDPMVRMDAPKFLHPTKHDRKIDSFLQILHVMTATLHHAHPVLAAASSAGFRESGLQSLRCLETSQKNSSEYYSASHSPIVAVRSSGLSLESIIGYCEYSNDNSDPVMRSLVTEEYLQMLVALANERFEVNKERVERFRTKLLDLYAAASTAAPSTTRGRKPPEWEEPQARKERKRIEGLKRQAELARQRSSATEPDDAETDMSIHL